MNVCFNGEFYDSEAPLLTAQNRSFKWGDGLFETMKVFRGKLLLQKLHFERLFISLQLLQIDRATEFDAPILVEKILDLCTANKCLQSARIRLAVYRNHENKTGYVMEAVPLEETINQWHKEGQTIVLYPYARKSMDAFANVKSANFLPYVLAQRYAIERKADDALVLNADNHLCDSGKANLFLVRGNEIKTPALHQGCINGVMRRVVIDECKKLGYHLRQQEVTEDDLCRTDEAFLTNAIQIIRWVKQYKQQQYGCAQTQKIFEAVSARILKDV